MDLSRTSFLAIADLGTVLRFRSGYLRMRRRWAAALKLDPWEGFLDFLSMFEQGVIILDRVVEQTPIE